MKSNQLPLLTAVLLFAAIETAQGAQTPNSYDCVGKNIHATLNIGTSKAEVSILPTQTSLSLQIGKKSYSFSEAELTKESTLIGDLWEAPLNFVTDVYINHASLLIPSVLVDNAPVEFESRLILTHVSTPFVATPPAGVVNTSRFIPVKCSASMLYY